VGAEPKGPYWANELAIVEAFFPSATAPQQQSAPAQRMRL